MRSTTTPNNDVRLSEAVVRQAARTYERDRYLAALLAPRHVRRDLIALAAFLGDLERIPLAVSEPLIGEIRLQWWRDALQTLHAGGSTGNPVADALGAIMRRYALPEALIISILDGRSRELDAEGPVTEQEFDAHLKDTEGAAFQLTGRVLGLADEPAVPGLFAAAGQSYGRVRVLRSLALDRARGRIRFPLKETSPQTEPDWIVATAPVLHAAKTWLEEARRLAPAAPRAALPAILPLALVEPYLAALEGLGSEMARETADLAPLTRVWRLWQANVLGRV